MKNKIKDTGKTKRIISFDRVSKAVGAEDTGVGVDTSRGPFSLFSLRQVLVDQLRSTGGRPVLAGTGDKRDKIRTIKGDWEKLKKIAKHYGKNEKRTISPGQIAAVVLHMGVLKIESETLRPKLKKAKKK
ncbi:MAG: hypothetical protein ISS33_05970 [Candidatus Omnitrophica bacterium]|nr:hypothetical protein [Candidatus Omnitrophota bacterium]